MDIPEGRLNTTRMFSPSISVRCIGRMFSPSISVRYIGLHMRNISNYKDCKVINNSTSTNILRDHFITTSMFNQQE